jgi:hypothetical protein
VKQDQKKSVKEKMREKNKRKSNNESNDVELYFFNGSSSPFRAQASYSVP